METKYRVIKADGTETEGSVDWPIEPGYFEIKDLVVPLLDGALLEHVSVFHNGRRADMFVDELGALSVDKPTPRGPLPRNEVATTIYRAASLMRYGGDPEDLPYIHGTAILFERIVWT